MKTLKLTDRQAEVMAKLCATLIWNTIYAPADPEAQEVHLLAGQVLSKLNPTLAMPGIAGSFEIQ